MYILEQQWTEPSQGNATYLLDITTQEANQITSVIGWLKENAGSEYGHTLSQWELSQEPTAKEADYTGIDDVLRLLAFESRYNEDPDDPGCYYNNRHPLLDNIRG